MEGIKTLGLVTLELEDELEQSWEIVRRTSTELYKIDKRAVTQENVTAFMSHIELKVAELLFETGNQFSPQAFAQKIPTPQIDFTKMPQMSEEEFNEGMRNFENDGEDEEGDVMFMSMDNFKKKLDMMSM